MFVVNDKEDNERQPPEMGFFAVISHSMLSALGITTVLLGPLPMILAELRLSQPWPRITALFGALLALVVLRAPVLPVVATFIFGLFVADSVGTGTGFWKLLGRTVLLAAGLGLVGLVILARLDGTGPLVYWGGLVDGMVTQLKAVVETEPGYTWEAVRALLFYEGPFLFLSGAALSLWISVGIAAHFNWFEEGHALSAERLRELRLPGWAIGLFLGLFVAVYFGRTAGELGYLGGLFRFLGSLVFIQGCVTLSNLMHVRRVAPRVRTLVYSVSLLLGFYALVGMGVLGPWMYRKRFQELEEGT